MHFSILPVYIWYLYGIYLHTTFLLVNLLQYHFFDWIGQRHHLFEEAGKFISSNIPEPYYFENCNLKNENYKSPTPSLSFIPKFISWKISIFQVYFTIHLHRFMLHSKFFIYRDSTRFLMTQFHFLQKPDTPCLQ